MANRLCIDHADRHTAEACASESRCPESHHHLAPKHEPIHLFWRPSKDALEALNDGTREPWGEQLTWEAGDYGAGKTPYGPDAASLKRYLETEILPWYDKQRAQIIAQPLVRAQALGESLDPDKLERLGRYEVHLDRKLERSLSTLIRLQELRRNRLAPAIAQA